MATLKALEVPIKSGNTITNGRLELGTVIKHLTLPVLSGGTITDVTYDLPSGIEDAKWIVCVITQSPGLYGETCVCKDSGGTVIDSRVMSANGTAMFTLPSAGTYSFSITF